jgi:16S rRNA (guanine(527)-N(7))-methyltransferase RsmG
MDSQNNPGARTPTLSDAETLAIAQYVDTLKAYDEVANVYSPSAYEKLDFHLQDAVHLANVIENPDTIVDLGSGSGLPSVILAILYPESQVFAVESKERKYKFLTHVKATLGLQHFSPLHVDAESVLRQIRSGQIEATAITAKAFMPPEKLAKMLQRFNSSLPPCYVPVSQRQIENLGKLPIPHQVVTSGGYLYLGM